MGLCDKFPYKLDSPLNFITPPKTNHLAVDGLIQDITFYSVRSILILKPCIFYPLWK